MNQELWIPVIDWPNYEVSNLGNVRSSRGPISTFLIDGYLSFNVSAGIKRKSLRVHREVLRSFTQDQPGMLSLHENGNRQDCRLDNLYWGDYLQNEEDKRRHDRQLLGERHHQAKLTESDVEEIRSSSDTGISLAKRFKVSMQVISNVRRRKTWRHV